MKYGNYSLYLNKVRKNLAANLDRSPVLPTQLEDTARNSSRETGIEMWSGGCAAGKKIGIKNIYFPEPIPNGAI